MSVTSAPARAARSALAGRVTSTRLERIALPALLGLAAANFLWQLGSSSFYVDEIQSIGAAVKPLGGVLHAVSRTELTPPAYFYFLHEWIARFGSEAEWVTRLPSAVCGVVVVAAVYWLAMVAVGRRAVALGSAALAALSPFVLEFAQRSQGYVFVMLSVTLAVSAALEAERTDGRRALWLSASACAAVISLWLHYTAGLVVLPLCWWVATRPAFGRRQRAAFVAACGFAAIALVPVLLEQHQAIPVRTGVAATAGVTLANVERVLATSLEGRVDVLLPLGAIVTATALGILIVLRGATIRGRGLLAIIAAGEPLALLALSALGAHLMLTRYAAVSAPFAIVAIAAAVSAAPRPLAVLLSAGAAAVALTGLIESHRASGFYLNARGVVSYLGRHARSGDSVLAPSNPGTAVPLVYYGLARFHPQWVGASAPAPPRPGRTWVISVDPPPAPSAARLLSIVRRSVRPLGYTALQAAVFPGAVVLSVVLEAPTASLGGR
jgi:uncharacterized membrane protein